MSAMKTHQLDQQDEQHLTPRQLTERAAAVAGITGRWDDSLQGIIQLHSDGRLKPEPVWRPLDDMEQSAQIVCQLRITVTWDDEHHAVDVSADWLGEYTSELIGTDAERAWCRAVVRCAASLYQQPAKEHP